MRRRACLALIGGSIALTGLGLVSGRAMAARSTAAVLQKKFIWQDAHPRFGGISAVHLAPDGGAMLAVSDRGVIFEALLARDSAGLIEAITITQAHVLRGPDGNALKRRFSDSEGIAVDRAGVVHIAFEGKYGSRVWAYDGPGATARALPQHQAFLELEGNGGLEALAIDAQGALYTLPEVAQRKVFRLFRLDGADWNHIADLPKQGRFLAVGADFGPDGRFYLLERRWAFPLRFASRLRRFVPGIWGEGETILETRLSKYDNHEAISVTATPAGRLRATIVSDDNFLKFQRTEVLEFLLPD